MAIGKVEVLTRKDIRDLSVVGGGVEVIDWVLYDTLTIATGGTQTSFRFFQQSIGQSGLSLESTDMEIPGQLPAGYKFVCQKLIATPRQGLALTVASLKDLFAVTHRGSAQLFIGTRPYLQVPMVDLVGGVLQGFAAGGVEVAYANPRTVISGEMEYAPVIPANYSFSVLVQYDTAPVLAANISVQLQAVGKLIRPRQG